MFQSFDCFGERLRAESEEEEVVVVGGGVVKMSGNERGVLETEVQVMMNLMGRRRKTWVRIS